MRAVRDVVFRRDGYRCAAAGFSERCTGRAEHLHHVRRRSQGGTEDPENLLSVCHSCHGEIHARPADAARLGLLGGPSE